MRPGGGAVAGSSTPECCTIPGLLLLRPNQIAPLAANPTRSSR